MPRGQRLRGHGSSKASAFSFVTEPRQATDPATVLFTGLLFGVEEEEEGSPCHREAAAQGSAPPRHRPLGEDDSSLGGDRARGVCCPLVPCCPAGSWGGDVMGVGVGNAGAVRTLPTPTPTYGRARPAGRRAGRARAAPGGTRRRCTRCTPASRGDTHIAPCPAERGDPHTGSTGPHAPTAYLSLQHHHGRGVHEGEGGDDEALVVAGEGQLGRGGAHGHQLRPVVVPGEGTPWRGDTG